jgi:hypothetical protein
VEETRNEQRRKRIHSPEKRRKKGRKSKNEWTESEHPVTIKICFLWLVSGFKGSFQREVQVCFELCNNIVSLFKMDYFEDNSLLTV